MECPKCRSRTQIKSFYYSAVNDTTPDLQTEIYHNSIMACMNKDCENYGVEVEVIKKEIELKG
jgi:hypothetical protein